MKKLVVLIITFSSSLYAQDYSDVFKKSIDTLSNIKSLTYDIITTNVNPNKTDTIKGFERCYNEFNIKGSNVGYKYIKEWDIFPMTQFPYKEIFDGERLGNIDWEDSTVVIKDCLNNPDFTYQNLRSIYEIKLLIEDCLRKNISDCKILQDDIIYGRTCQRIKISLKNKWFYNGKISDIKGLSSSVEYLIWIDNVSFFPLKIQWRKLNYAKSGRIESVEYRERLFKNIAVNNLQDINILVSIPKYFKIVDGAKKRFKLNINTKVPDWNARFINGDSIDSKKLIGQITLIDFTMTSCGACIKSIPSLNMIQKKYGVKKLNVISVFVDNKASDVLDFKQKKSIDYKIIVDSNMVMSRIFKVSGFPTIYIIDKSGMIKYSVVGYGVEVEEKIIKILNQMINK